MKGKVLIVDDSKLNSGYLRGTLDDYNIESLHAYNGLAALEILESHYQEIKAITLDRYMPLMDGAECARRIKGIEEYSDIPIIFVTSMSEKEDIVEGLEIGVYDYLIKPVDGDLLYLKVKNAMDFYNQKLELKKLNKEVIERNDQLERLVEKRTKKLQEITNSILNILESATSINDQDTGNHIQRVANYSALLAEKAGLSHREIKEIRNYSPLHDIGKLGVADYILKKEGPLTPEEFEQMKTHVTIGEELLKSAELPKIAINIIKYHHEKWNGKGYLFGLKGEEIPVEARIVAIADVFDALTSKRPYKEAFSIEEAIDIMTNEMTKHFDPNLLELFFQNIDKIREIKSRLSES